MNVRIFSTNIYVYTCAHDCTYRNNKRTSMSVQLSSKKQKRLLPSPLSAVTHEDSVALLHASWVVGGHSLYSDSCFLTYIYTCNNHVPTYIFHLYMHSHLYIYIHRYLFLSLINPHDILHYVRNGPAILHHPSSFQELRDLPGRLCTVSTAATSHVNGMLTLRL